MKRQQRRRKQRDAEIYQLKRQGDDHIYVRERTYAITPEDLRTVLVGMLDERQPYDRQPGLSNLVDDVAGVIAKSYVERGDGARLADDIALLMIRELLLTLDSRIIERQQERPLPKQALKWLDGRAYRRSKDRR